METDPPSVRFLGIGGGDTVSDEPIENISHARLSRLIGIEARNHAVLHIAADAADRPLFPRIDNMTRRGSDNQHQFVFSGHAKRRHGGVRIDHRERQRGSLGQSGQLCPMCIQPSRDSVDPENVFRQFAPDNPVQPPIQRAEEIV